VKAAVDAGATAARAVNGEIKSIHVIARPHDDLKVALPE
jgi:microcompartment protein CcmL/EutN